MRRQNTLQGFDDNGNVRHGGDAPAQVRGAIVAKDADDYVASGDRDDHVGLDMLSETARCVMKELDELIRTQLQKFSLLVLYV